MGQSPSQFNFMNTETNTVNLQRKVVGRQRGNTSMVGDMKHNSTSKATQNKALKILNNGDWGERWKQHHSFLIPPPFSLLFSFTLELLCICLLITPETVYKVDHLNPRRGTQKSFIQGGSAPRSNPLPFYRPFFSEKAPLLYTFYWKKVPLSYTFLRRLFSCNHCHWPAL